MVKPSTGKEAANVLITDLRHTSFSFRLQVRVCQEYSVSLIRFLAAFIRFFSWGGGGDFKLWYPRKVEDYSIWLD